MQNLDDIELKGALNKAEFYPADNRWAELIGVYEIDGENWLFFHTAIEMGYYVPSVKFIEETAGIKFSPRRLFVDELDNFILPKNEKPVVSIARWLKEADELCPFDKARFTNRRIWVAKFTFPKNSNVYLCQDID